MGDLLDFIVEVFIPVMVVTVILVAGVMGCVVGIETYTCNSYEKNTGIVTNYSGLNCYVTVDGKTMLYEEYRNSGVGNKIKIEQ